MSFSLLTPEKVDSIKSFQCSEGTDINFLSKIGLSWSNEITDKQTSLVCRIVSISQLPEEIIYLIFSFLSVKDLLINVKRVSKMFDQMLSESYFKRRTMKFLDIKEIPRPLKAIGIEYGTQPVSWKYACFKYEFENDKWSDKNFHNMFKKDFSNNTSSVDVAKILANGKLLVSGGRDRVLTLWNIENSPNQLDFNESAHSGWIWDVIPYDDQYYFSCDWDGKIIKWSLSSSMKDPESILHIGRPILSLSSQDNILVAGLQTGEISVIDPRTNSPETVVNERVQRSAVMAVEILGTSIISISEDKSLSVFDLRNNTQIKKSRISSSAIPVSMSIINSGLFIAQTNGTVSLINTSSFKIWEVYKSSNSRLTSIHASRFGSLITASRDKCVTIYSPGKSLRTIRSIELVGEAAKIDYSHGILAIARSDNKVTIFNTNKLED